MPKLGGVALTINTDTVIYTSPSGKRAIVTINMVNSGNTKIGLCPAGATTITTTDVVFIGYITDNNTTELKGITPSNGERILANSDAGGSVVVWGYEEP